MPARGYTKRKAEWDREEMLEALRQWVAEYGEVPAATDFHPSDCRYSARISLARSRRWLERADRFERGTYPWPGTVRRVFGSWGDYLRAAGLQPRTESIPDLSRTGRRTPIGKLKDLADSAARAEGDERRAALYRLADAALALAEGD